MGIAFDTKGDSGLYSGQSMCVGPGLGGTIGIHGGVSTADVSELQGTDLNTGVWASLYDMQGAAELNMTMEMEEGSIVPTEYFSQEIISFDFGGKMSPPLLGEGIGGCGYVEMSTTEFNDRITS